VQACMTSKFQQEEKVLQGPPMLTWDIGYPCCVLTAVLVGLTVVFSRLGGYMTVSGSMGFGFATLHLGATINDGGKSVSLLYIIIVDKNDELIM